ncbi:Hypothetical protein SRAE_1000041000 [Strongyloides ratti]|uniref:Uncharacterized protein n=1 Tax=Strongyloides ratti TaxID=34506 RepID=A0A090KXJ5_STRRB|nr:Hypothetical protein SRAE_1000041000 [Strongyloides ratti]CEF62136.1 Hypothetical protein SRAE_1000041000 [Strongyloides ratti]
MDENKLHCRKIGTSSQSNEFIKTPSLLTKGNGGKVSFSQRVFNFKNSIKNSEKERMVNSVTDGNLKQKSRGFGSPFSRKKNKMYNSMNDGNEKEIKNTKFYSMDAINEGTWESDPNFLIEQLISISEETPIVARSIPKGAPIVDSNFEEKSRRNCLFEPEIYDKMLADSLKACDLLKDHLNDCVGTIRGMSPQRTLTNSTYSKSPVSSDIHSELSSNSSKLY